MPFDHISGWIQLTNLEKQEHGIHEVPKLMQDENFFKLILKCCKHHFKLLLTQQDILT